MQNRVNNSYEFIMLFGLRFNSIIAKVQQPLHCFQNFRFCHDSSVQLVMDSRKGKKNVVQLWRPVSTRAQPSFLEDGKHEAVHGPVEADTHEMEDSRPTEKHSLSMKVGWSLMRFIVGRRRVTQDKIEAENNVKLIIPKSKGEDSIVIEGPSVESISEASRQIQNIVNKVVNSRELDYSHFVSLPLATHSGLVDKLISFQNRILGITGSENDDDPSGEEESQHVESKASNVMSSGSDIPLVSYLPKESKTIAAEASSSKLRDSGIDKSIFIKPRTFHLTVLMLKLWNKDRVEAAAEVLKSISSRVIDALENRPVSIKLKGLECLKGSLAKARVVYAPVEELGDDGRLLRACQVIIDAYVEAGLVLEKDAKSKLKLHATVMNTRHRRNGDRRKYEGFDARGVFELYGGEEWGEYVIGEAHLSERFAFDENGYYRCRASIPFCSSSETVLSSSSRGL